MLERLPNETPREFVRRRTEAQRLFSVTPDGLDTRALQPDEANRLSRDRGLSPDGKWIVYSKQVEGVVGLYLQEQSSGTERLLDRGSRRPWTVLARPAPRRIDSSTAGATRYESH